MRRQDRRSVRPSVSAAVIREAMTLDHASLVLWLLDDLLAGNKRKAAKIAERYHRMTGSPLWGMVREMLATKAALAAEADALAPGSSPPSRPGDDEMPF